MGFKDFIKKLTADFVVATDAPPLTHAQARGLALAAPLTVEGTLAINTLDLADFSSADCQQVAGQAWGATDSATARAAIENALHQDDAAQQRLYAASAAVMKQTATLSIREQLKVAKDPSSVLAPVAAAHGVTLADLTEASERASLSAGSLHMAGGWSSPEDVPTSLAGWNCGRLAHATKIFTKAGYLSTDEAWTVLEELTQLSREQHTDWADYGQGFLFGRSMWVLRTQGVKKVQPSMEPFVQAVDKLNTKAESPWATTPW